MKHGKGIAFLLTLLFLAAAVGIGAMDPAPEQKEILPLSVGISTESTQEQVRCWQHTEGSWYCFLPGHGSAAFLPEAGWEICLNGVPLTAGADCSGFETETPYPLTARKGALTMETTLTLLRSEAVPTLYIDTRSGSLEHIHSVKGNEESGSLRLYTADGALDYAGEISAISGRGNYSWNPDKKPYSVTLLQEGDLLGLGSAQRWVLSANYSDHSHLRNKLVCDFAAEAGLPCSPDSIWVELYLNGDYAGLYLLSERNEIHPQRVAISRDSTLVSMEVGRRLEEQNYPHIIVNSDTALRIHSGQKPTEEFADRWKQLDRALQAEDGIDPETGIPVSELIDLDSWVKKYLLEEIFANLDGGTVSQYFYVDADDPSGKIYCGPAWDYDLTMGSRAVWQTPYVQAFYADKAYVWSEENPTWFYCLCRQDFFRQELLRQYREVFRPQLTALLEKGLHSRNSQLHTAAARNALRWNAGDMAEETAYMQQYLQARLIFLDSLWLDGETYCRVMIDPGPEVGTLCHAVRPGQTIPGLPEFVDTEGSLGWYNQNTGAPFDENTPIWEDTVVYLKPEEKTEGGISKFHLLPLGAIAALAGAVILADRLRYGKKSKRIDAPENV